MRHSFLFLTMLLTWAVISPAYGQFLHRIRSEPASAEVYLNGQHIGTTPVEHEFIWKQYADSGMHYIIKKAGFNDVQLDITRIPKHMTFYSELQLESPTWARKTDKPFLLKSNIKSHAIEILPTYKLDSNSAIVGFDKVVAVFPTGKKIGTIYTGTTRDLEWKGFATSDEVTFRASTIDMLGNRGFRTPATESAKLFKHGTQKLPRYILGAEIKFLWSNMRVYSIGYNIYDTEIRVEWQVWDQASKKVVYKQETPGMARGYVPSNGVEWVEKAYLDALRHFLMDDRLFELASAGQGSDFEASAASSIPQVRKLPKAIVPKFDSNTEMIQFAANTCVTIATDAGHGSGAVISGDGMVITAYHVVDGTNRIEAVFSQGMKLEAKLLAYDAQHDIALLQIPGSSYKTLPIGSSKNEGLGAEVITIGTPGDIELGQSVSKGIVSGKRKHEEILYIQTDVAVSPGNSGGPLINSKGEIIGIIQRKIIGVGIEGVGFALPIEVALKQLNIVIE